MEADEEGNDAKIMSATRNIQVNELCIVDFVDLKVGKQSKLFSAERCSGHFIYEGIVFFLQISSFRVLYVKTNEAFDCLRYRHLISSP